MKHQLDFKRNNNSIKKAAFRQIFMSKYNGKWWRGKAEKNASKIENKITTRVMLQLTHFNSNESSFIWPYSERTLALSRLLCVKSLNTWNLSIRALELKYEFMGLAFIRLFFSCCCHRRIFEKRTCHKFLLRNRNKQIITVKCVKPKLQSLWIVYCVVFMLIDSDAASVSHIQGFVFHKI